MRQSNPNRPEPMNSPATRNFDFFRVAHAPDAVDMSQDKLREWNKREGGPQFYRMKDDDMVWARYSEVEAYILSNSKVQKGRRRNELKPIHLPNQRDARG